jgi:hypothetical protein
MSRDTAIALLLAWSLLGAASLLFYVIRWRYGLKYGFGTELFALLFAVDMAILIGLVDPGPSMTVALTSGKVQVLALVLSILTICSSILAVDYEYAAEQGSSEFAVSRRQMTTLAGRKFLIAQWLWPH